MPKVPRPTSNRSLRPAWLVASLALVGLLYLGLDPDRGVSTWLRLRQEVSQAEARIDALKRANDELEADLMGLRSDDFTQERAIRELLGWARPGEVVVRVPEARTDALDVP